MPGASAAAAETGPSERPQPPWTCRSPEKAETPASAAHRPALLARPRLSRGTGCSPQWPLREAGQPHLASQGCRLALAPLLSPLRPVSLPPLRGQTLKTLLLCPLIKGSFYPTPDFFLLRLFNCLDANDRPLSGEPHSETMACPPGGLTPKPLPSPVPFQGDPLRRIKLAPASRKPAPPANKGHSRREGHDPLGVGRGAVAGSLKNSIVSQGYSWFLFLSFH